jgi:hypothetical protein
MGIQITWRTSPLASGLHAAEAIGRGLPIADPRLAASLEAPAQILAGEVRAANLPEARFWTHLLGLSGTPTGRRLLVETAIRKTAGKVARLEELVARVAAAVAGVETAMQEALPALSDELELRIRPLREQWEARGLGLMQAIGWRTDESLIVKECDVLAVYPALGGGGGAHLPYNSVRIEAVLANPIAELPEVVRLAWLIGQLHLEVPIYSESIHAERLPYVAAYAMLPPTLAAAEELELVHGTPELIRQAAGAWQMPSPPGMDAADLVHEWWQTFLETRPPWNVALAALDRMFG